MSTELQTTSKGKENQKDASRILSGDIRGEDVKKTVTGEYGFIGAVKNVFNNVTGNQNKPAENERQRKQREGAAILAQFNALDSATKKQLAAKYGMTTGRMAEIIQKEGFNILSNKKFQSLVADLNMTEKGKKMWKNLNATGNGKQETSQSAKGFNTQSFLRQTATDAIGNAWDASSPEQKKTVTEKVTETIWDKAQAKLTENKWLWIPVILIPAALVWGIVAIVGMIRKKSSKKGKYNG